MENVRFAVEDPQKEANKVLNNMLQDKISEKFGDGHVDEFSIQEDMLTIRTTKKTFSAPIQDITVTYIVNNFAPIYTLKAKNGDKIGFARTNTFFDDNDNLEIEKVLESLPGFKGRNKFQKIYLILLVIIVLFFFLIMLV